MMDTGDLSRQAVVRGGRRPARMNGGMGRQAGAWSAGFFVVTRYGRVSVPFNLDIDVGVLASVPASMESLDVMMLGRCSSVGIDLR